MMIPNETRLIQILQSVQNDNFTETLIFAYAYLTREIPGKSQSQRNPLHSCEDNAHRVISLTHGIVHCVAARIHARIIILIQGIVQGVEARSHARVIISLI